MGLDAGVRCRCWDEGKTTPCPFPGRVRPGDDMDLLELDLPWQGNEKLHNQFERWRQQCCAHQGMWLVNERISNWGGVRDFQQALRSAGATRFPTLLAQIPNLNGGRTPPASAQLCLPELDAFAAMGAFGSQIWLVDAETGSRLHNYVEAYDGVFIMIGSEGMDVGVDHLGFFVRRPDGQELFRSSRFEQIQRGNQEFEFRDCASSRRITCSVGVEDMTSTQEANRPIYPRLLEVTTTANHSDEYRLIVERLRSVFAASVETKNPVSWF